MSSSASPPSKRPRLARAGRRSPEARAAGYRYGVVFVLLLLAVVFVTVAPDGRGTWAGTFALMGGALIFVAGTSREPTIVLRRRATIASIVVLVLTIAIAAGAFGTDVTFLLSAAMVISIPVSLVRGLLRLVRKQGATGQAVAGGLAIYLSVGLAFAFAIGFVAAVGSGHYFAQGTNGSNSEHVYYSFTVLTTTGFGDLTAAHGAGRALAVIEMLSGQLYLVTVIGVLVGLRVGRRS